MINIASVIGARPQFIKAAAVSRAFNEIKFINEIIIHTGQHYDEKMSAIFFDELKIPKPDYNLGVGSASHGRQTGLMLERVEDILIREKPDLVVTYGDTNSTIAAALAAVKLHIPVAHIEAGLRSFNRKMPEEINRIATDHISDILFAPTQNAMELLKKEGLYEKAVFSGDVMYDSILFYKKLVDENFEIKGFSIPEKYYLSTIHRPENTDNPQRLKNIFEALSELDAPVLLPLHPRTKEKLGEIPISDNVKILEPVGYLEIIFLLKNCEKVLTDSGGLQKEAYFMDKPCLTLREQTEWVETLENNWNFIVGADKNKILNKIKVENFGAKNNAFGDGRAAYKIVDNIIKFMKN